MVLLLLIGAVVLSGCAGVEDEEAEQRRLAQQQVRENAEGRQRARMRANAIEGTFDLRLQSAGRSIAGCRIEYRPDPEPKRGVLPIACGDFERKWPLRIDRGYLRCEHWPGVFGEGRVLVFAAPSGREYAVNDAGHAVGYQKLVPLLRDPTRPRLSRQPLIDRGLRLCG